MEKITLRTTLIILIIFFVITSVFVLSFPYPIGKQSSRPSFPNVWTEDSPPGGPSEGDKSPPPMSSETWAGGTVPDEGAYFGWAQIYFETGKIYVPLEEVGPTKIQHVDFFIGNTPEDCIFAKVDISKDDQAKTGFKIKSRNITVTVYDGNNKGIVDAVVEVEGGKQNFYWSGLSKTDGTTTVANVPPGTYSVNVNTADRPIKIYFSTDYQNLNYPLVVTATLKEFSHSHVEVNIHVDHYVNPDLADVDIYLGLKEKNPIGITDEYGNYSLQITSMSQTYHVVAKKETNNIFPPVASGIAKIDGDYAIANHWPPGYCYLIIPFWISGMIHFINIFTCAIACISTYFLTKRLYDQKTAVIASILVMTCGLAMVLIYGRGMADYAAMAFATAGVALFIESIQDTIKKNRMFLPIVLGFLGGLSFAFAVTMRYSTVIVLAGPFVYILIQITKKSRSGSNITTKNSQAKKRSKKKFCLSIFTNSLSSIKKSLPFILGLLVIGGLLASYNISLFGGPLNSGYQMDTRVEVGESGNATLETPGETMFEQYFSPSLEGLENTFDRVLPQLFLLLPTLFIAPLGFLLDFKRNRSWLLLFWMIPTLFIYMQLTWVGQVPVEDMRYFLPVLPPTAILTAYALNKIKGKESRKNLLFVMLPLTLLIITGFLMAHYGINWQIHRRELGRIFEPYFIAFVTVILAYGVVYSRIVGMVLQRWKEKHL